MRPIQLIVVIYVWFGETYRRVSGHCKTKPQKNK